MLEIQEKGNVEIVNMIYEIRGIQVMLDSDLANLYQCKNGTKTINQAVKRNIERFPNDFYFQLTECEYQLILRSQLGTLELKQGQYSKYLPFVFTEQGVAMLATVLRTEVASIMSVNIMRAFVNMRRCLSSNLLEQKYINNQVMKNTEDIKILQMSFKQFDEKRKNNEIFFEGQIYDAYSLLLNIIESAKKDIIIIDNYANQKLLDLLSKTNKKITIYSSNMSEELIKKYNSQYSNVSVVNNTSFHDRFIIIDKIKLYHSGSSFKDLGKKCFAINLIEDNKILNNILKELERIK